MSLTRRRLLKQAAAASAAALAPGFLPYAARGAWRPPPSERITLGFIGVGGHGTNHNLQHFLKYDDAQVVAVCDVDAAHRDRAATMVDEQYGNRDCARYNDFREVLRRDDVDAVVISTPDHWHVLMSVMAARAGKDVFCEKPTLTIEEGRILSDTIAEHDTIFQAATEDRAIPVYHRMAELVRNGVIGDLHQILVRLPGADFFGRPTLEEQQPHPVPEGLDYDLWLGPAPYAPYAPGRTHFHFRWIFDYSGGMLTDWGAHLIDTAQWANDTERTGPVRVTGMGVFPERGIYDTASEYLLEYEYADGVRMVITSGGTSIRFEGSDGWLGNEGWRQPLKASSDDILNAEIPPDGVHLFTEPAGEHRNFLDCVKSRRDPYFPAEILHRCSTVLHLGNVAMLLGRSLEWDPDEEAFVGDAEANAMRSRELRDPWRYTASP